MPKSIKKGELAGRRDLRERTVVTVDGEDAKDLDDAVYVEQINDNEYLLGVYIADVSYYVTEDSVLDKEARRARHQAFTLSTAYCRCCRSVCRTVSAA